MEAAYTYGLRWLQELKDYLKGNYAYLKMRCQQFPRLELYELEAGYLVMISYE